MSPAPVPPGPERGGEAEVIVPTPAGPAVAIALTNGAGWDRYRAELAAHHLELAEQRGHLRR